MEQVGTAGAVNQVRVDSLHDVDRRILKESLRVAGRLQQRLRLDYER
jgi:CBS domain-containing protein